MAELFTDSALSVLSAYFADLACKEDVGILRSARTPDGQQGFREVYSLHETIKCLVIASGTPRFEQIAQQTVARNENLFCFPVGTDVGRTDRLSYKGETYEIIDLLDPSTYTVWQRVLAKHMEAGGAGS